MSILAPRSQDRVRRRRLWTAIGTSVVLVIVGSLLWWDTSSKQVKHYLPSPAILQSQVDCSAAYEWRPDYTSIASPAPDNNLMGSVPSGFRPAYAVNCGFGKALGQSSSTVYLTGDFTELLAALSVDSDRQGVRACTDQYVSTLNLWLVNAQGKAIHVMEPIDVCSRPKPEVRTALEKLSASPTPPAGNS